MYIERTLSHHTRVWLGNGILHSRGKVPIVSAYRSSVLTTQLRREIVSKDTRHHRRNITREQMGPDVSSLTRLKSQLTAIRRSRRGLFIERIYSPSKKDANVRDRGKSATIYEDKPALWAIRRITVDPLSFDLRTLGSSPRSSWSMTSEVRK